MLYSPDRNKYPNRKYRMKRASSVWFSTPHSHPIYIVAHSSYTPFGRGHQFNMPINWQRLHCHKNTCYRWFLVIHLHEDNCWWPIRYSCLTWFCLSYEIHTIIVVFDKGAMRINVNTFRRRWKLVHTNARNICCSRVAHQQVWTLYIKPRPHHPRLTINAQEFIFSDQPNNRSSSWICSRNALEITSFIFNYSFYELTNHLSVFNIYICYISI